MQNIFYMFRFYLQVICSFDTKEFSFATVAATFLILKHLFLSATFLWDIFTGGYCWPQVSHINWYKYFSLVKRSFC